MSGRHVTPPTSTKSRKTRRQYRGLRWRADAIAIIALVSVTAAVLAGAVALNSKRGSHAAASSGCRHTVELPVLTSPAISASVRTIAAGWVKQDGLAAACVRVIVTESQDAAAEAVLASGSTVRPAIWIPSSSVWSQRLVSDLSRLAVPPAAAQTYPSIASSPLVLVTPPPPSAADAPIRSTSFIQQAASGKLPFAVLDPVTSSEGLLSLIGVQSSVAATPASSSAGSSSAGTSTRALVGLMVRLGQSAIPTLDQGFAQLASPSAKSFAASEQAVIARNRAASSPVAAAVYPDAATAALDYPFVSLTHAGDDAALAVAVADFQRALRSIGGQQILADAGFRDAAGDPLVGVAAGDPGAAAVTVLQQPSAAATANALRLWSAATAASHTLAVIDVSGSMAAPAGNGQSRIQLAATAAADGLTSFPDDSAFGLWAFSSAEDGGTPWTSLAPVTPLGATTAGITQRQRLVMAAAKLPGLVMGGHTALHDTTLAAFQEIRNTYQPGKVNSVVLLTDGQNDYPSGVTLDTVLSQLRLLVDASRPVAIIAVGVGDQADISTLQKITAVTGGKTYAVKNPADVSGVFLDAVLQRQCRPSC